MKVTIEYSNTEKDAEYIFDLDNITEPFKSHVVKHMNAIIEPFELAIKENPDDMTMIIESNG